MNQPLRPERAPRTGLVLSGGAARGAYQAGVMRYIYRTLPRQLGFVPWPEVVSGTSVGALNGTFAVSRSEAQIVLLSRLWRRLRIPDVFVLHYGDVLGALRGRHRGRAGPCSTRGRSCASCTSSSPRLTCGAASTAGWCGPLSSARLS